MVYICDIHSRPFIRSTVEHVITNPAAGLAKPSWHAGILADPLWLEKTPDPFYSLLLDARRFNLLLNSMFKRPSTLGATLCRASKVITAFDA